MGDRRGGRTDLANAGTTHTIRGVDARLSVGTARAHGAAAIEVGLKAMSRGFVSEPVMRTAPGPSRRVAFVVCGQGILRARVS